MKCKFIKCDAEREVMQASKNMQKSLHWFSVSSTRL